MQCNAMQCNAMQCNAMQCNAMQCNAINQSMNKAPVTFRFGRAPSIPLLSDNDDEDEGSEGYFNHSLPFKKRHKFRW
jgi:hypothetical protein